MAATSSGPLARASASGPSFTMAGFACNFCGLQEIRLPALSLPMTTSLCFGHGRGSVTGPRSQTKNNWGAGPLSSVCRLHADGADRANPGVCTILTLFHLCVRAVIFTGQPWLPLLLRAPGTLWRHLHTRQGEVLAERQRCPSQGGIASWRWSRTGNKKRKSQQHTRMK